MLTLYDEFAGVGGSTKGATQVPDVEPILAVNHWQVAVDSHAANFPSADHECAKAEALDMAKMPRADIFLASPACPPWTDARGKKRDFDKQTQHQGVLFGEHKPDENIKRARALMEEVPRYLRAMALRGKPVLVGVVENVVQCRLWADWDRWIHEIEVLGYRTRLIAFNSMHARAPRSPRAPQSRDRLYLAYWHVSLGRDPDWDKWLRPKAYCATCDEVVSALQVFKKPGADMGRYRSQYVYRCPRSTCRHQLVEPEVLPALAAIDPTIPGLAIKDRPTDDPLAAATMERIKAGIRRWWLPLLRAQITPNEAAQTPLPFVTPLRGGGDKGRARPVTDPLTTVCAAGNHHGLALPPLVMRNFTARGDQGQMSTPAAEPLRTVTANGKQSLLTWSQQLLVPYYGNAESAFPATAPIGALTARDRYGLAQPGNFDIGDVDLDSVIGDVLFRMLEPHEIAAAMAFDRNYKTVAKSKRDKVRLYGNAVTPPVMELVVSALVETITGKHLDYDLAA